MQAALYARVSTPRQGKEQTIDSQLSELKHWAQTQQHTVDPQHIYRDEGYSGSRLDRPALDVLRDAAADGAFELLGVLSPDRLARKYAYQVLLEELRRAGCEVVFLLNPISDDPNDQLLLQIQGAIAEYERAVLAERFRRGKLQKAREGHWPGGRAPYGYSYGPKQDGVLGYLVINETEATLVKTLYSWLTSERMTLRQILKRLNLGPYYPRSGKNYWSVSVVHHILADTTYAGTAYANKYRFVPAKKPRRPGPAKHENSCRQLRPKEAWIPIPVPALMSQESCDLAQAQLQRNAVLSYRNNSKYNYLLRCLLSCPTCGLAMQGVIRTAGKTKPGRQYYKCNGKDPINSAREQACQQRPPRADDLEAAVWGHVAALLAEPERLRAQFAHFAQVTSKQQLRQQAEKEKSQRRIKQLAREESRLLDAYQAELIELEELSARKHRLAQRRRLLLAQQQQQARLFEQQARAQETLGDLERFCARIHSRLEHATFEEKQAILQLIERIIVGEDSLEIRHVIPLRSSPQTQGASTPPNIGLRSDGMNDAKLGQRRGEAGFYGVGEACQPVDTGDKPVFDTAIL